MTAWALATLTTSGGYRFDFEETGDGAMREGTMDAFDTAYILEVNGTTYNASGMPATMEPGGRSYLTAEVAIGALRARRHIYVPMTGGNWARYIDLISNPGTTEATATVTVRGNLGSDSATRVLGSSTGDTTLTTADLWFSTDDTDGSGDSSVAHVVQGASSRATLTSATLTGDVFRWTFSVTVPAGGRAAIMSFVVQGANQATVQAEAMRLADLPDDSLQLADEYMDSIANFSVSEPGAPRIRFDGPFEAVEGASIELDVDVQDLESDPVTFSWDANGDGTFGDTPGATSYVVPAGTTDGPSVVRIGVQASDGTHTTERYRSIAITNVAPMVSSTPRSVASVGATYVYDVAVADPGGDNDPFTVMLTMSPTGMSVSGRQVTWTPNETDITGPGESVRVELTVDDGDGGTAMQGFDLMVSPNRAPGDPMLLYPKNGIGIRETMPRLVVSNATDPDLDALTYFFELDVIESFDSPMKVASGAIAETPGFSYWYPPAALAPGRYYWRAWVSDGSLETTPMSTSFFVVPDPATLPDGAVPLPDGGFADASTPPAKRDSSCATTVRHDGSSVVLVLVAAGLLMSIRRRRRGHSAW